MPLLEIFALAVGSMFWPLLLVVVLLALRTSHPVKILVWFYLGGMLTTVTIGAAIVFSLQASPLMTDNRMPAAPWIDVAIGALALIAAAVLHRLGGRIEEHRARKAAENRPSKSSESVQRLVESGGPLAFVGGIVANVFPGALPFLALADIAQLGYSTAATIAVIVGFYVVMFTFVEVPIVGYALAPERTAELATRFNAWLGNNVVRLGMWALIVLGAFEVGRGLVTALH